MTQRSSIAVRGNRMRHLITAGIAVAVCIWFIGLTRGLFASGSPTLPSAATATSDKVLASESADAAADHEQRLDAAPARGDDDGYVEGLAATLGYQSPELMMTGSLGSGHAVAQR